MNEKYQPPIVSPFSEPESQPPAASLIWKGYLLMFLLGVASLGILIGISYVVDLWTIGIILMALYIACSVYATYRLYDLKEVLDNQVQTHQDLLRVREVIDLNMKLAFLMMIVIYPLFVAFLLRNLWMGNVVFAAISLVMSPFMLKIERQFKAMAITPEDPTLEDTFADLIRQWKEPRFGLRPLVWVYEEESHYLE